MVTGTFALCRTKFDVLPKNNSFGNPIPLDPMMIWSILFLGLLANVVRSMPELCPPITTPSNLILFFSTFFCATCIIPCTSFVHFFSGSMGARTAENALKPVSLWTPMIVASEDCFANEIAASTPRRECFEPSRQTMILLSLIKKEKICFLFISRGNSWFWKEVSYTIKY